MIPLIGTIIAIYCSVRLIGLLEDVRRRNRLEKNDPGTWILYFISIILIAILCLKMWNQSDEFTNQLNQIQRQREK